MYTIEYKHATLRFNEQFKLADISWRIEPNQVWAIVGANGSGKSALAASLAGDGELVGGETRGLPQRIGMVSLEAQAALIKRERDRDDSDLTDEIFEGTPAHEILDELCIDKTLRDELVQSLGLSVLLERAFRKLSTGETRKLILARALTCNPDLLVLDEPFEGLDAEALTRVEQILAGISRKTRLVMVFNRLDEIPSFVTHVVCLQEGRICHQAAITDQHGIDQIHQLLHLRRAGITIPEADPDARLPVLDATCPLVRIHNASVRYAENVVFEGLDWCIRPGQHWQLVGPNGSGKTCLLNLINGDHPQCYTNDIYVFGYQRGRGESIWEIKQHIGYVSTSLQWEYRVSISVRNVILSGFYDSIGLYNKPSNMQVQIADAWLGLLHMESRANQPFNQLSFGEQRLLLIARAMVKRPHLLILDEPCLGLDDINRELVLALISRICESGTGTTVIYVNHHAGDRISGISEFKYL